MVTIRKECSKEQHKRILKLVKQYNGATASYANGMSTITCYKVDEVTILNRLDSESRRVVKDMIELIIPKKE